MDSSDLELVRDAISEDRQHQARVMANDNCAALALANYKSRSGAKYGSALVPAILIGLCILTTCVAIWRGWL